MKTTKQSSDILPWAGYVNVKPICEKYGKKLTDYVQLQSTAQYLHDLSEDLHCEPFDLIHDASLGSLERQGTFFHVKLTQHLMWWLESQNRVNTSPHGMVGQQCIGN